MSPHLLVCVFLSLSLTAAAQDLSQIVISPEDVLVYQGRTVILPCVAYLDTSNATQPTISWRNGTSPLTQGDPRVTIHALVESDVRNMTFVRGVLEVCDVRAEDANQYSCVLSTNGVERDTAAFNIIVTTDDAPTQVLVAPNNIQLSSNETVVLSCVAHAFPPPTISWFRNGYLLSTSENEAGTLKIDNHVTSVEGVRLVHSRLEMCNTGSLSSGMYNCLADNQLTNGSADFQVGIQGPILLLNGPSESKAHVGSIHTMSCDFHGFPRPTISWSGVPLTSGGRFTVQETIIREGGMEYVRSELSISPVADYDEGVIVCTGDNGEDQLEHSFTLEVFSSPQILISPGSTHIALSQANNTLTLACVGHSSSHITWRRDGRQISTNSNERVSVISDSVTQGGRNFVRSVLEMCGVSVTDSGEYSCIAVGNEETDVATFDVCAIDSTGLLVAPSNVTIATGHTLSLSCVGYTTLSNANSTHLQWTRDNIPLDTNNTMVTVSEPQADKNVVILRGMLLFNCIESEAAGHYGCHVISDNVVRSEEFDIAVQTPPIIKDLINSTYSVPAEGTVSFVCIASGDPLPNITWLRDNIPLNPNLDKRLEIRQTETDGFDNFDRAVESVLTINNARETDAGYYSCRADSEAGETELTNVFQLLYNPTTVTDALASSSGLGHGTYVGNIVGIIFFLAILIIFLSIKPLRQEPFTPALVNCCISLVALNFSYIISYNVLPIGTLCVFFAAIFHYFFLVGTLSIMNLVLFQLLLQSKKKETAEKKVNPKNEKRIKKKVIVHVIAFIINWGVPLFVMVISVSPNISNYTPNTNTHFCGPTLWPYWLGEFFLLGLLHLPLWFSYIIISVYKRINKGRTEWAWHVASTGSTLFLFDITWVVGLLTTQHKDTSLHAVFLVVSIIFGLCSFILYCFTYRRVRVEIMKIITRKEDSQRHLTPPPSSGISLSPPLSPLSPLATELDALFQDRAFSMSGIEAGKLVQVSQAEIQSREIITSFTDSLTKEDLEEKEAVSPDYQEDNGSDVFPCMAEVESINQTPPITSFGCPLDKNEDLASRIKPMTENYESVYPTLMPAEPSFEKKLDKTAFMPIPESPPTEPKYLPIIHSASQPVTYSQEDDVFVSEGIASGYAKERRYDSRTLLLSGGSQSDDGGWPQNRRLYPPSRQGSVTGPHITRFALV